MLKNNKGIIQKIRRSRAFRGTCALLVLSLVFEIAQPTVSLALTEGPSQPEVQSFEPINTTQMVDLFTGDFNYNIPLFNLPGPNGGYPVNLAYHAGATMDDEASWVGLGWNINAGSLVRNVRGLPDDFKTSELDGEQAVASSDHLIVKQDRKPSRTLGASGSFQHEIFGCDLSTTPETSLQFSLSGYYNNYRGFGMSVGMNFGKPEIGPFSAGLSIDGENGLGITASLKDKVDHGSATHSLSLNFDGNLSVSYGAKTTMFSSKKQGQVINSNFGTGYSFYQNYFSPSISSRTTNFNFKIGFSGGPDASGFFEKFGFDVWYNWEKLDPTDQSGRRVPVVGYERGSGVGGSYLRDYSRQRDGQVTRASIFLANANYMYDTYNSTGQGLSGYFRARRNDVGKVGNETMTSNSQGINLSFEIGVGGVSNKWGVDPGVNWGSGMQKNWLEDNDLDYDFGVPDVTGIDERVYFQAHGEQTILHPSEYAHINGLDLATAYFTPKSNDGLHNGKRKIENENSENAWYNSERKHSDIGDRVVRNTLIHTLKNSEVEHLGEFQFSYYTGDASLYLPPNTSFLRDTRTMIIDGTNSDIDISSHNAGFKVLNQEGSYYVYGLPAYNNKEVENTFSCSSINSTDRRKSFTSTGAEVDYDVDGTHESIYKSTKTPYAHSYMLTSVLGADYIDLTNNGPSEDDMGYWVKFDYVKSSDNYSWRAPYEQNMGQVSAGAAYTPKDDKLSYQYGEKEIWYLGRIETKTHIALFITDKSTDSDRRKDGLESAGEMPSLSSSGSDRSRKLKEIRIYDKKTFAQGSNATPMQIVHFNYEYSLCAGVPNQEQSGLGKLTLKEVWFESFGSTRGQQNKYSFGYAGVNGNAGINPSYTFSAYDMWGGYRPEANDAEHQMRFPYVNQFNQDFILPQSSFYGNNPLQNEAAKNQTKQLQDDYASAWCLNKITLPSGGTIDIKYESDDYGYVQHKTANQMFKITKLGDFSDPNELYDQGTNNGAFYDPNSNDDEARRRIYFKLEQPIPTNTSAISQKIYSDYVDPIIEDESGNKNLYFKSRMRLTRTPDVYDYISGYLPLEPYSTVAYGVANTATIDGVTCYTHGFVTIQATKKKHKENGSVVYFDNYHPMSLVAWTYLQTNAQELLNNPNSFSSLDGAELDQGQAIGKVIDLLNVIPNLASSFGAIRKYCKSKDMARFIDLNKSCIRLASPDKIKFGGGHRVKQITITDNWASDTGTETDRTYGQEFEYTVQEGEKLISSGVAQYEPMAGGDENALKYPINYYDRQTVFTRNNLFVEAPLNEELFPGANVGYRKVTVKSLNTAKQMRNASTENPPQQPVGRTGGVAVHEFFTAKEFPTIVKWSELKEENNTKEVFLLPVIVPFVGSLKRNYYYGSQSFLIELNDMHGKPRSASTYELNNYVAGVNPITYSEYEYQAKNIVYQQEQVQQLDNNVRVIPNDGKHSILKDANNFEQTRVMGIETELYTDQREFTSKHNDFAIDFNMELFFLPLVTVWPTVNNSKTLFRTYVTNKVIHRTGIVKKVKSRDLQTVNESEILAYDEKSGIPLLTRVKNEFGDDFYNYNVPAYYAYDRMGHAYRNINYTFTTPLTYSVAPSGENGSAYLEFDATAHLNHLVRGDELLILDAANDASDQYKKVYFLGWKYDGGVTKGILHSPFGNIMSVQGDFLLKVIRSGRRNNFGATIANYLTKGRPQDNFKILPDGSIDYKNVDLADATIQVPQFKANTVLSATAAIFRDDWSTSVQTDLNNDLVTENPFLTGNSGIWRPYKSYTYVGPRKSTAGTSNNTSTDPALYNDGVFTDEIKLFTWDLGNIEDYVSNWEWVNEITRYSPDAYELENRNRLGIYSSALYGYDNNLSIGVSGNSGYHETGVMDFEKCTTSDDPGTPFAKLLAQTNLNFDNNHTASTNNIVTVQVDFKKATVSGKDLVLLPADNASIPSTYFTQDFNGQFVGLSITSRKTSGLLGNMGFYFNGRIKSKGQTGNLVIEPFLRRDVSEKLVQDGGVYHGVITFFLKRSQKQIIETVNVDYVTSKAHTGKKSMKLLADVVFDQPRIRLVSDKTYILSLWISRHDENVVTYKPASGELVEIGKMNAGAFASLPTAPVVKYGKIVEGWQKIDIEFKWDAANGDAVPAIRFIPGSVLYVDDIRISPKTGGLVTYVFDTVKYWLTASLNVDNYATLYYYDEEGNLHLKKQETEKGIFTVTESRGHVSKQP